MWQRPRECSLPSPLPCENRGGRSCASLTVLATRHLSAPCRSPRRLLASSAEVLWRGAEAAGVADAVIKAHLRYTYTRAVLPIPPPSAARLMGLGRVSDDL